ncbi:hypothetical protein DFJ74DRAFT_755886 [Hyaloraphidium curvatum]|nr:hypothetical protein DFJ74DRAFT_755886 [Hyaloraphidium curvatum]
MMTPQELLAVLPRISELPPSLPGLPTEPDAETREALELARATPPTQRDLVRAAARASRLLGALAKVALPLAAPSRRWLFLLGMWLFVPGTVLAAALYPVLAAGSPDDPVAAFGSLRLGIGAAGIAWFLIGSRAIISLGDNYAANFDLRRHMLAALARWSDVTLVGDLREPLAKAEDGGASDGGLTDHVEGDTECACARCNGRIGTRAVLYVLAEALVRGPAVSLCFVFFPMWTPAFSGARLLWTTWWGALLGASAFAGLALNFVLLVSYSLHHWRTPIIALSGRLQRRAVSLRLSALVLRYRALLLPPDGSTAPAPVPCPPYEPLLRQFSYSWNLDLRARGATVQRLSFIALLLLPPTLANLALSCIPAWELAALGWWALFVLQFLLDAAAGNARIGGVEAAIRAARQEMLALLAEAAGEDPPAEPTADGTGHSPADTSDRARERARAALAAHASRLGAFLGTAEPARFFGFAVGYGTARTLLVTLLTLVFAAWGVLRALGVRAVLESYCPLGCIYIGCPRCPTRRAPPTPPRLAFPASQPPLPTRQLAGGFAVLAFACAADPFVWLGGQMSLNRSLGTFVGTVIFLRSVASFWIRPAVGARYMAAGFLRQLALLPAWFRSVGPPGGSGLLPGSLLGHEEGDDECPCSGPGCCGGLLHAAPVQWLGARCLYAFLFTVAGVMLLWTPLFAAPEIWAHWWSILLAVLACALIPTVALEPFTVQQADFTLVKIEGRVRRRLLRRALGALLARARRANVDKAPFPAPGDLWGSAEPYMQFHAELRPRWRLEFAFFSLSHIFPVFIGLYTALVALSIAIGGCVPAWTVAFLAYYLARLLVDLWSAAAANREIALAGKLYSLALSETRELLVLAQPPDAPQLPPAAHLAAHAGFLARCVAESSRARRKFLGFEVGYGNLRALLVSLATVAFAAWGAARGFGVAVVLGSVCPG